MKRTILALIMLTALSVVSQVAKADVSVDFFYNNLSGGNWIEVGDYGYCWQPDVAVSNADWRPYADGYWAYTDEGWTWVSYEDFGWATYHYGRWARLQEQGWVWVPGRDEDMEWGPAWVSWRSGDQYVGWAPLPPTGERIYEGRAITGHVDVEYDIGPAYYNFVDVRYIGEPVLRERIIAPAQNVTYINQTVNVTNITYKNKVVYNYGPDINVINQRASSPIQRLTIQRESNVDYATVGRSGGLKTRVQGQSLVIAAPVHIAKSDRQFAPPSVKTKVAKANLDTGWSAVGDAKAKEQFKQKLRREDAGKVSRNEAEPNSQATFGGSTGTGARVATSPVAAPTASATASVDPRVGRDGKHGRGDRARGALQTSPSAATAASATETASPAGTAATGSAEPNAGRGRGNGKHRGLQGEQNASGVIGPSPTTGASVTGSTTTASPGNDLTSQGRGKHNGRRNIEPLPNTQSGASGLQPTATPVTTFPGPANDRAGRGKGRRGGEAVPGSQSTTSGAQPSATPAINPSTTTGARNEGAGQGRGRRRDVETVPGTPSGRSVVQPTATPAMNPSGTTTGTSNEGAGRGLGRNNRRNEPAAVSAEGQVQAQSPAAAEQGRRRAEGQGQNASPAGDSQQQGQGGPVGARRNRVPESSPSPSLAPQ